MTTDAHRWRRVEALFNAAVDLAPAERAAWLESECAGDAELAADVLSLLAQDVEDRVAVIVSGAADAAAHAALHDDAHTMAGRRVGAYRIVRELGRGGMGTVYLAERADGQFDQRVAIKFVRERLGRPDLAERFREERRILATLEHPNIARLLDGGTTEDGAAYVVMEHVEGLPLDRHCAERELGERERLRLFVDVCDAVQYAHGKLIVHRDLKPDNVLVTTEGVPKLLDFGIAKLLDDDGDDDDGVDARGGDGEGEAESPTTRTALRILTPEYASPEQVRGEAVTTASDVYSLGVTLHRLLTGEVPYRVTQGRALEFERAIVERAPALRLRGDLERIAAKALRKEPERRYATAAQLGEDLRRYLGGHPVSARPDSLGYRAGTFVRRNAVGVAAAVVVVLALAGAAVGSTTMYVRAERAQTTERETGRFLREMLGSVNPAVAQGQDTTLLRRILDQTAARVDAELGERPDVAAALHDTIGSTDHNLGLFAEAERHHRAVLRLVEAEHGADDRRTAAALRQLSGDLREQSRYDEAEQAARRALAIDRAAAGDADDLATAESLHALGLLHFATSHAREAEPLLREALRVRRERLGEDDPLVGETLLVLSAVVDTPPIDDVEQARALLLEARAIFRRAGDRWLFQLADVAHNLGENALQLGAWDDAEAAYRESLAIKRRILPPRHPEIAVTMNRLASLYETRGSPRPPSRCTARRWRCNGRRWATGTAIRRRR